MDLSTRRRRRQRCPAPIRVEDLPADAREALTRAVNEEYGGWDELARRQREAAERQRLRRNGTDDPPP